MIAEHDIKTQLIGHYLTLEEFCLCTQTYKKYADSINPWPENIEETIPALRALAENIIDPIIKHFGIENFRLTYGFCSTDLKKYLERKDALTGEKNGKVAPGLDQHMAYEKKRTGKYQCERLGASCDFIIHGVTTDKVIDWIVENELPFDSLYYYGDSNPLHISYGPQHKKDMWGFLESGQPTKKTVEHWRQRIKTSQ
jgi:hypothetical protein